LPKAAHGKGKDRDMSTTRCYSCKKYGHISPNCPKQFYNYCKQQCPHDVQEKKKKGGEKLQRERGNGLKHQPARIFGEAKETNNYVEDQKLGKVVFSSEYSYRSGPWSTVVAHWCLVDVQTYQKKEVHSVEEVVFQTEWWSLIAATIILE